MEATALCNGIYGEELVSESIQEVTSQWCTSIQNGPCLLTSSDEHGTTPWILTASSTMGDGDQHSLMDDDESVQEEEDWNSMDGPPFQVLSRGNSNTKVQVLTPAIMMSLQDHLPYGKRGQNFWLQYSMVRDGASLDALLEQVHGKPCSENNKPVNGLESCPGTILALETVDGEVFGCYTTNPWRVNGKTYYGDPNASFLWRLAKRRRASFDSLVEYEQLESSSTVASKDLMVDLDVYKCGGKYGYGENDHVQLCTQDRLVVGGGGRREGNNSSRNRFTTNNQRREMDWGFAICLDRDLLYGTSSPCLTFGSPSLSERHFDGSAFEICNVEVWTLTPCLTLQQAETYQHERQRKGGGGFFTKRSSGSLLSRAKPFLRTKLSFRQTFSSGSSTTTATSGSSHTATRGAIIRRNKNKTKKAKK